MNCLNVIGKASLAEIEVEPVVVDSVDYSEINVFNWNKS